MFIVKTVLFCVVLVVGLVFFTLYRNDANLFEEPGVQHRLTAFLTTNVAETRDGHVFAELSTPVINASAERTYQRIIDAAADFNWIIVTADSDNQSAHFVVRSPVFLFEDDVYAQVKFIGMDESSVHIRSSSRKGRGDFAANSSHIQKLIGKIR